MSFRKRTALALRTCLGISGAALMLMSAASFSEEPPLYETTKIPGGHMDYELLVSSFPEPTYLTIKVEHPQGFKMGTSEVTQNLWNQCVGDGACRPRSDSNKTKTTPRPVVKVNWHDAYGFSQWISAKTGKKYRLPTEHEWFYAASMGKPRREASKVYDYANLEEVRRTPKKILPSGAFGKNAWGLLDTEGNVWEWTLTCYALAEESLLARQNPDSLNNPDLCVTRITGGEHRAHVPDFIEDTYNGGCATLKPASNLGFRLVLED